MNDCGPLYAVVVFHSYGKSDLVNSYFARFASDKKTCVPVHDTNKIPDTQIVLQSQH